MFAIEDQEGSGQSPDPGLWGRSRRAGLSRDARGDGCRFLPPSAGLDCGLSASRTVRAAIGSCRKPPG